MRLMVIGDLYGCKFGINPRTWKVEIVGNTLAHNQRSGLYLNEKFRDIKVINNTFIGSWISSAPNSASFRHDNFHLIGNTFLDSNGIISLNVFKGSEKSLGLIIKDNLISGCNYTGGFYALTIGDNVSGVIVNNDFIDSVSGGIRIEGCEDLLVSGNTFKNISVGQNIRVRGATRGDFINNHGDYNSAEIRLYNDVTDCRVINNYMKVVADDESVVEISGNYETRG